MRKAVILVCMFGLLFVCLEPAWAQEAEQSELQQAEDLNTTSIRKRGAITYDPADRRDPFRDLLAGQDVDESLGGEGIASLSIDDLVLLGITKVRGKRNAVIKGPQGFPHTITTGDKFTDGFVLSIDDSKVTFRKTRERGVPLYKPKDVIKEINPEER